MCVGCGPRGEALSAAMEFDHVITVHDDGTVTDGPRDVWAPELWNDDDADVTGYDRDRWELLTGYTGQYSYSGAVMHSSEFIGGGLARDILDTPGVYVAVVVECEPSDDDGDRWPGDSADARLADYEAGAWRPEPAGWAVARLREVDA